MTKLITILFFVLIINTLIVEAQKYDFNWMLGYDGGKGDPRFGITQIDFNIGNPMVSYLPDITLNIETASASISSSTGNLLYYTNGYDIEGAKYKLIANGNDLGIRYWSGLRIPQGVMFLPYPNSADSTILFYPNLQRVSPYFYVFDIRYLIINKIK
jgi:hypothetical protein